jgi:hypothetical protein
VEGVKSLKRTLEGLVLVELDKNAGDTFVCCPAFYNSQLKKQFHCDTEHFRIKPQLTVETVKEIWKHAYESLPEGHSPFPTINWNNSDVPLMYILPKDKAPLKKTRPISPYSKHPFKRILSIAAAGLNFLILNVEHYTLNVVKPENLLPFVMKMNEQLTKLRQVHPETRACIKMNDVSQMFTELPHEELHNNVCWFLDFAKQKTRRHHVSIPIRFKDELPIVLGVMHSDDYFCLSFTQISAILKMDRDLCYCRLGQMIYIQYKGLPMGSPPSPPSANVLCLTSEQKLKQLKRQPQYSFGKRYMDDILTVLFLTGDDDFDKVTISDYELLTTRGIIYPKEFILKPEGTDTHCVCLGADLSIGEDGSLDITYHNKNADQLDIDRTQRYPRFQHILSYAPDAQKKATIIGELHRIDRMTLHDVNKMKQLNTLLTEFKSIGIPDAWITHCIVKSNITLFQELVSQTHR